MEIFVVDMERTPLVTMKLRGIREKYQYCRSILNEQSVYRYFVLLLKS